MTSTLFTPTTLGPLRLPNRVVMAPMTRSRALGNTPNALMARYYVYGHLPFCKQRVLMVLGATASVYPASCWAASRPSHDGIRAQVSNRPSGFAVCCCGREPSQLTELPAPV